VQSRPNPTTDERIRSGRTRTIELWSSGTSAERPVATATLTTKDLNDLGGDGSWALDSVRGSMWDAGSGGDDHRSGGDAGRLMIWIQLVDESACPSTLDTGLHKTAEDND
jgi:hypothetical protein